MQWLPTACYSKKRCLIIQSISHLPFEIPSPKLRQPLLPGGVFDGVTVSKAIDDLLVAKTTGNRRADYLKSLGYYLRRFAKDRENTPLSQVTTIEIELWLNQFKAPGTRQTWLTRISTLFSFGVRRGHLQANPCEAIERVSINRKAPAVLTVEQAKKLMDWCPTAFKPYLILAMFAGIRPQEIERLDWNDINLETKTVRVNIAKVQGHRRIVPLEPIAVKHLSEHPLKTGAICPSSATLRRWKRRARETLGFDVWPKDIFRHTAASYLVAKHENIDKVAKDLGNSRKILLTHYHEPITKEDAEKFWNP